MARLLAPELDWSRYGRGASRKSSSCYSDNLRHNINRVPIPPTVRQVLSAYAAAIQRSRRNTFPFSPRAFCKRLIAEVQLLMQASPSGDQFTPIAERICHEHLNGF